MNTDKSFKASCLKSGLQIPHLCKYHMNALVSLSLFHLHIIQREAERILNELIFCCSSGEEKPFTDDKKHNINIFILLPG